MPKSLPLIGNKEKALVHVAKQKLGLSDEDYRAILASVGVSSSKELNHVQLDEVMRRFHSGGFRPINKFRRRKVSDPKAPLLRKIAAILGATGLTDAYVNGMAVKMFGVQSYLWLDVEQLWKVVAALSIYVKRKKKRTKSEPRMDTDGRG
jgi:phage gp16-like protein